MNKTTMSGDLESHLASVDPGNSVTESELARSRARSLSFLTPDAGSVPHDQLRAGHLDGPYTPVEARPAVTSLSSRRPRRFVRRVVLASAAAAMLVGAIVAADVIVPGSHGGATAEAAEVLNAAAAATITTSDPLVGPGQYLKIDTTAVYAMGVLLGDPGGDRRTVEWLDKSSDHLYVPADQTAEWIWNREARIPTTFFSEDAKAEAAKYQQSQAGDPIRMGELLRAPGGNFYGEQRMLFAGMPLLEGVKTLPRDPQALLDTIRQRGKQGRPEAETLEAIAEALGTGVVPADLRAALYKAAALIPGVTVVDRQANLDGKVGTAIGIERPGIETRMDIIIDPATGLLIGEREVALTATADFPAGTATSWTSVQTSVVDSAP
ncbi:CU044_5270 family protein [Pseudarthrobacter sp. O4]|uniref:CU044_5270 family protein n=1 Tax=Pseudarthrobacter sp. O4 TaxID=3418417 RepID=UPI003CF9E427